MLSFNHIDYRKTVLNLHKTEIRVIKCDINIMGSDNWVIILPICEERIKNGKKFALFQLTGHP